jgi:hypothetical protein
MKKSIAMFFLCGLMLALPALEQSRMNLAAQTIVTAAQVNGTWKTRWNTFKIWALGDQKLRIEFFGTYPWANGEGVNTGEGSGIATIEGNVASFRPEDADEDCMITLTFTKGKLVVEQQGFCGFGHNVMADGTYKKKSGRKPKFDR